MASSSFPSDSPMSTDLTTSPSTENLSRCKFLTHSPPRLGPSFESTWSTFSLWDSISIFLPPGTCSMISLTWKPLLPNVQLSESANSTLKTQITLSPAPIPGSPPINVWSVRSYLSCSAMNFWVAEILGFLPGSHLCSGICSTAVAWMSYTLLSWLPSTLPGHPPSPFSRTMPVGQHTFQRLCILQRQVRGGELFWWPVREDSCPGLFSSENSHWLYFLGIILQEEWRAEHCAHEQLKCLKPHENPASLTCLEVTKGKWRQGVCRKRGSMKQSGANFPSLLFYLQKIVLGLTIVSSFTTKYHSYLVFYPLILTLSGTENLFLNANLCEKSSNGREFKL